MEAGIWRAGWHFGCHRSLHLPTEGDSAKRRGGSRETENERGRDRGVFVACGSEAEFGAA